MTFLNDNVKDSGLAYAIANGTKLDICSSEPASFAAIAGVTLGNDTVTTTGPQNGSPDGREFEVPAITTGSVTATGTATHWALSDGAGILVATNSLSAPQAVTSGNTFTLDAIQGTFRDATSV